ncbi:MAG: hypothetical protein UW30_C0001G0051 [Candidatus Giovannonibacteria bacterium GW2011_GWA2_44_13b]|uniref:Uncharacterized protein n=1 Tax=Candidatus Giovannonibacteria bacterium GW2011_GWA2_44_13b TaxID=1618647 RepID=A0A0G1H4K8_9BACT|nr:MAG: hypothetical protein UW30_C0001G0051 [Candidatus Giovannonibacteria bacterium GW2011_GWA2_44_13b]
MLTRRDLRQSLGSRTQRRRDTKSGKALKKAIRPRVLLEYLIRKARQEGKF